MLGFAKKIFGSSNDRKVKGFMAQVLKINALEAKYAALSDGELRMMTDAFKDRLESAGIEVHGAVDHGIMWSIYFYDPNGIPLEITWECMEITGYPAIVDDRPLPIAAEGSAPRPDMWPAVNRHTPREQHIARAGNGHALREGLLAQQKARMREG